MFRNILISSLVAVGMSSCAVLVTPAGIAGLGSLASPAAVAAPAR
jgi:hypothetical protein